MHGTRHLISAAALVGNPEAIKAFAKTVASNEGITGVVRGLGDDEVVAGVAVDEQNADVGRLIVIELNVPLTSA